MRQHDEENEQMPDGLTTLPKPLVLVVEDEASLATMLRYNLEKQGYRVEEAADTEFPGATRRREVRSGRVRRHPVHRVGEAGRRDAQDRLPGQVARLVGP